MASVIPHPIHVPRLHQPASWLLPILYINTPGRGKAIWLSRTRPHGEDKSCGGIHDPSKRKANKAHSLALAVSYSLCYDKHYSNPTICSSPVEMLNLLKSCVLPHFLLYLRYISDETQVKTIQASLNKPLSTTIHVYGYPTALLSETGIPSLYITQTRNLQFAQHRFGSYSSPLATIQHFLWCLWQPLLHCKQCPWIRLKTAFIVP